MFRRALYRITTNDGCTSRFRKIAYPFFGLLLCYYYLFRLTIFSLSICITYVQVVRTLWLYHYTRNFAAAR